jgi:hypothetical protein
MRFKIMILTLTTMALAACGNKGGSSEAPPTPTPILPEQVSEADLRGKPSSFAGTWRGDCVIEVGPHRSTSCALILKIRQDRGVLDITQDVRATFEGTGEQREPSREVFTYRGNQIQGREGRSGAIGSKALTIITPPSASNNGSMVRTTMRKTGPGTAVLTTDSLLNGERATVRAELRAVGRPLPRARSSSRN